MLAGRYELRGLLGCGGMAEVRDGWDNRLARPVAVKLLHPGLCTQPDVRRRFADEARAAAALHHPNIVNIYDVGFDAQRPFIVMERLSGSLLNLFAAGPLPPLRVRRIFDDVLAALAAAHAAGIVHRDIKPGNILLSDYDATKVGDFGIAKLPGGILTATGQIVGTMAYMSPERISGAPAGPADDLYALGVVGFEALTGRPAFAADNPVALARAIAHGPPPPVRALRPDADPAVAEVVDRALAHDPGDRFATAVQMRAALDRGSTMVLGHAVPIRPVTRVLPGPPVRRRRVGVWLAAIGALVAGIITALAVAADPSPVRPVDAPSTVSSTIPPPTTPSTTPVTSQPASAPPTSLPVQPAPRKGKGRAKGREDG